MSQQGLPWQVRAFAGGGENRMPFYKVAMVLGLGAAGYAYWSQQKGIEQKQEEAVEKWGAHGEKAEYGKSFKDTVQTEPHFPGTSTGAASGSKTS